MCGSGEVKEKKGEKGAIEMKLGGEERKEKQNRICLVQSLLSFTSKKMKNLQNLLKFENLQQNRK